MNTYVNLRMQALFIYLIGATVLINALFIILFDILIKFLLTKSMPHSRWKMTNKSVEYAGIGRQEDIMGRFPAMVAKVASWFLIPSFLVLPRIRIKKKRAIKFLFSRNNRKIISWKNLPRNQVLFSCDCNNKVLKVVPNVKVVTQSCFKCWQYLPRMLTQINI